MLKPFPKGSGFLFFNPTILGNYPAYLVVLTVYQFLGSKYTQSVLSRYKFSQPCLLYSNFGKKFTSMHVFWYKFFQSYI